MPRELRNISASVRARRLDRARAERSDFQILLTRYALERLLYRLSVSEHRDGFILKGAMLFVTKCARHAPTAGQARPLHWRTRRVANQSSSSRISRFLAIAASTARSTDRPRDTVVVVPIAWSNSTPEPTVST